MKILIVIFLLFCLSVSAREVGQTEITTSGGIEVFKQEKYYLLKDNVEIVSDEIELKADLVKAFFEKDLYDLVQINSQGNVSFKSNKNIIGKGKKININVKTEDIYIEGEKSLLVNNEIEMKSDGFIEVNNSNGKFKLNGPNSRLLGDNIDIKGSLIEGIFININNVNEVQEMYVEDNSGVNIQTETLNMFSQKAKYNKKEDIIELFDNVKIIRNNESVTGDYAKINTVNESYKVTSNDTKKVKIILNETAE